jgi:2-polyprenyl-3-methyl-5-hydroxy-6-metoxy-1,4-benzoquinol methylase
MPNQARQAAQAVLRDSSASVGERLLLLFCRKPGTEDFRATTASYTLDNALNFARKTIPSFDDVIRDKLVLDYGCGHGWQAVAMYKAGARRVTGTDILDERLAHGRALAEREGCAQHVAFSRSIPDEVRGQFDVVLSLSAFEHFDDPAAELQSMESAARPGGAVVVSFAEPWLSPHGSHMIHFTKLPWVNVLFSERSVMRVRSRFRSDGATRYEEVVGGLNRMTVARFEQIIRSSGMAVESLNLYPVKGLPLVTKTPVVREFFTAAASCILRKS